MLLSCELGKGVGLWEEGAGAGVGPTRQTIRDTIVRAFGLGRHLQLGSTMELTSVLGMGRDGASWGSERFEAIRDYTTLMATGNAAHAVRARRSSFSR